MEKNYPTTVLPFVMKLISKYIKNKKVRLFLETTADLTTLINRLDAWEKIWYYASMAIELLQ